MFGMEGQSKKKNEANDKEYFDIEQDLKDPDYIKNLFESIENKLNIIKKSLREGDSKENFQKLGTLLQGYTGLTRVLLRAQKTKNK